MNGSVHSKKASPMHSTPYSHYHTLPTYPLLTLLSVFPPSLPPPHRPPHTPTSHTHTHLTHPHTTPTSHTLTHLTHPSPPHTPALTPHPHPSHTPTLTPHNSHLRLQLLQRKDDEKLANEQARNNLESHIFETKDAMYSEAVMAVSTEDQREVILAALTEAGDWMEEEGYGSETKVSCYS